MALSKHMGVNLFFNVSHGNGFSGKTILFNFILISNNRFEVFHEKLEFLSFYDRCSRWKIYDYSFGLGPAFLYRLLFPKHFYWALENVGGNIRLLIVIFAGD